MGIIDKITGRAKQAAGDITGDENLRQQGVNEERKGEAREEAEKAELRAEKEREKADELRREAAKLETGNRSDGTGARN
jgi:uncharacterized protein YjbJ (UPF0337 family)